MRLEGGIRGTWVTTLKMAAHLRRTKTIGASPGRLREARDWAGRVAAEAGLDEGACFEVRLAASEVVANAIEHGPCGGGEIVVDAYEERGQLTFEVRDGGRFALPPRRAGVEDERGRGLELVRLMMDGLDLSVGQSGSSLRFSRRLR